MEPRWGALSLARCVPSSPTVGAGLSRDSQNHRGVKPLLERNLPRRKIAGQNTCRTTGAGLTDFLRARKACPRRRGYAAEPQGASRGLFLRALDNGLFSV